MGIGYNDQDNGKEEENAGVFDLNQPDRIAGGAEKLKFSAPSFAVGHGKEQGTHSHHRKQGIHQQIGNGGVVVKHKPGKAQQSGTAKGLPPGYPGEQRQDRRGDGVGLSEHLQRLGGSHPMGEVVDVSGTAQGVFLEVNQRVRKIGKSIKAEHFPDYQCPVGEIVVLQEHFSLDRESGTHQDHQQSGIAEIRIFPKKIQGFFPNDQQKKPKEAEKVQNSGSLRQQIPQSGKKQHAYLHRNGQAGQKVRLNSVPACQTQQLEGTQGGKRKEEQLDQCHCSTPFSYNKMPVSYPDFPVLSIILFLRVYLKTGKSLAVGHISGF